MFRPISEAAAAAKAAAPAKAAFDAKNAADAKAAAVADNDDFVWDYIEAAKTAFNVFIDNGDCVWVATSSTKLDNS